MTFIIVLIIVYIVEMFAAYIFFSRAGKKRFKTTYCVLIGLALFASAFFINILGGNIVWFNAVYFSIMNLALGVICFRVSFGKAVMYSVFLAGISMLWEFGVEFVVTALMHTPVQSYLENNVALFIVAGISKPMYFVSAIMLSKLVIKDRKVKIPPTLYIYPASILASTLVCWYVCLVSGINEIGKIALSVSNLMLLFPMILLFLNYQNNVKKENELLRLKSEMNKAETEKTYYSIIKKQNENLKSYADDAKNHLEAIRNLNSDPQIEEYINKMSERLTEYSSERQNK